MRARTARMILLSVRALTIPFPGLVANFIVAGVSLHGRQYAVRTDRVDGHAAL